VEGDLVRRGDFAVRLSHEDDALRGRILEAVRARGFEGPTAEEAAELVGEPAAALRPVLDYLASGGVLARTKEGFYFDAALLDSLVERVIAKLAEAGQITVADIKAFTNASRKYTIPLMEHLDGRKVTQRKGEVRVAGARGRTA
jgi:selenocysteine-specific elongation factor